MKSNPISEINLSEDSTNNISNSSENLLDVFNGNSSNNNKYQANSNSGTPDFYKNTPLISSNGALVPHPYRSPPPPRNSPMQLQQQTQVKLLEFSTGVVGNNLKKVDGSGTNPFLSDISDADFNDHFFDAAQYKDLIQLIKFQREKITSQQSELTKYDAEIVYLENKERDQAQELEATSISREITKANQIFRQGSEQLQTLQYVEEEDELVQQREKALKSEITMLRSRLPSCGTELLQCRNKMRILMDDVRVERGAVSSRQKDNRQNVERDDVSHFKPNELTVKTVGNNVVVEGKHEEREDDHGYISRQFVRKYQLPKGYDAKDVISTVSTDGVLTVKAPPPPKALKNNERIVQIQQTGPAHLSVKGNEEEDTKQLQNNHNKKTDKMEQS